MDAHHRRLTLNTTLSTRFLQWTEKQWQLYSQHLRKLAADAMQANEAKSTFLAVMRHVPMQRRLPPLMRANSDGVVCLGQRMMMFPPSCEAAGACQCSVMAFCALN